MLELNRFYVAAFREADLAGKITILFVLALLPALVIGSLIYLATL